MRVVIDTNVFVSALISADGAPRKVIRFALEGQIEPVFGNALFAEYEDVLAREALFTRAPLNRAERSALFDALLSVSRWTSLHFCGGRTSSMKRIIMSSSLPLLLARTPSLPATYGTFGAPTYCFRRCKFTRQATSSNQGDGYERVDHSTAA
jgi:conserved hypothetical protein TIGR00305